MASVLEIVFSLYTLWIVSPVSLTGMVTCQLCDCSCPDGWVSFRQSCYLFADTPAVHYTEAENYCQQRGGHLVSVESALENGFLKTFLQHIQAPDHWLGLTDELVEGFWTWGAGGPSVNFTNWRPGQPDNYHGAEDCAIFERSGGYSWDDNPCRGQAIPLCEKRLASYLLSLHRPLRTAVLHIICFQIAQ